MDIKKSANTITIAFCGKGTELYQFPKLTECEEMIMKIIWSEKTDPNLMTVTEKANECCGKKWKIQTVATFLTRIKDKGYIEIYKCEGYSYYHPLIEFEKYKVMRVRYMLDLLFDGDQDAFRAIVDKL